MAARLIYLHKIQQLLNVFCINEIYLNDFKVWPLVVCRAHRGLLVGFLLLRYSVLFTVESFYLLYLLVLS